MAATKTFEVCGNNQDFWGSMSKRWSKLLQLLSCHFHALHPLLSMLCFCCQGRFLSLAQSPSDILVTLGGGEHVCNVTSVEADRLLCLIPVEVVAHKNTTAYLVEVRYIDFRNS